MHKTLNEDLVKWMKTLRKTFKDDMFSRYDMKPDKPLNKKDRKVKMVSVEVKSLILIKILNLMLIKILKLILIKIKC